MKPYLAYKDSGVAWLGEAPKGWEVVLLSYTCSLISGEHRPEIGQRIGMAIFHG